MALYGDSGTCVFTAIDLSYSFALQREKSETVFEYQENNGLPVSKKHNRWKCEEKEEKVQTESVYLACQPFTK